MPAALVAYTDMVEGCLGKTGDGIGECPGAGAVAGAAVGSGGVGGG